MITLEVECKYCNKIHKMPVFKKDLEEYNKGEKLVQECFPYISPEYRELLISGMCPECWDKLYEENE